MFISRNRFEELVKEKEGLEIHKQNNENIIEKQKAEIETLKELLKEATEINNAKANENGCMIGEWCKKCKYGKRMCEGESYWTSSWHIVYGTDHRYFRTDIGYYCTRHMKDICPEFKIDK